MDAVAAGSFSEKSDAPDKDHQGAELSSQQLLVVFDPDPRLAEAKYRDLHQKLIRFFAWNRKADAEDLAQETLKRGLARLQQGRRITTDDPAGYFFGIARNLIREGWRARHEEFFDGQELRPALRPFRNLNQNEQLVFLGECLRGLENDELHLLIAYVEGEGEAWAMRAGISLPTLRSRVHRLRKRLEQLALPKKPDANAVKQSLVGGLRSQRNSRRKAYPVGTARQA